MTEERLEAMNIIEGRKGGGGEWQVVGICTQQFAK